ncbi:MAG: hypothetical protein ACJAZY_002337 [Spirosomataceae bacterium]|jgi:hypothetical protein
MSKSATFDTIQHRLIKVLFNKFQRERTSTKIKDARNKEATLSTIDSSNVKFSVA